MFERFELERWEPKGGETGEAERFLSAQADRFAGANREEKVGLLRSKCRGALQCALSSPSTPTPSRVMS
jgi:hypothetical protein